MSDIHVILDDLDASIVTMREQLARQERLLEVLRGEGPEWVYPVGSLEFPPEGWYCATWHDVTGRKNNGYAHTGIDLNVWQWPRGDIDRGQPEWAVADGVVHRVGYSVNYLGSVIIRVEHDGRPLYVRYWHLADDDAFRSWREGMTVKADDRIGHIGNYTLGAGGDHLHFDMCLDPFEPHWWHTKHPNLRWVDPVPILKAHLDPAKVHEMLARGE